jgi:hypothetical protein
MARVHASASELLLPLIAGGLCADSNTRITSASALLQRLDQVRRAQFQWELFDGTSFASMSPDQSFVLETAFLENRNAVNVSCGQVFDITSTAASYSGLSLQILPSASVALPLCVRRVLRASMRTAANPIPVWQHLLNNQEWMQCPPWQNAALSAHPPAIDAHLFRTLTLRPGSLCSVQISHEFKTDP